MSTEGDIQLTQPDPVGEGSDIDPIRTETIFSRMPLHVLSKSGPRPQINIEKRSAAGKVEEKWEVTYNEKYGPARQLAYDVHTLVVERAIEEGFEEARRTGQPLPRLIPLKSLNDIAKRLGLAERDTNSIKKALSQNAGILITAFKRYRGNDGIEHTIEGVFTPYGIFFFGQHMPGGRRADQVYLNLNDAYFDAWSKSTSRPLDYNYKAQLPPIPRRFYELVSYAMYGAIKNNHTTARYRYSEFCKNAPQLQYDTFDQVKKQMYKIHKPHIDGQYILKVKYEETTDERGAKDWWMVYTPGPRAYAEFSVFTGKKLPRSVSRSIDSAEQKGAGENDRPRPRQASLKLVPEVNTEHLAELTKRGVSESGARKLLAKLPSDHPVLDLLEWADNEIANRQGKIHTPAGFYIRALEENAAPPPNFISRRQADAIRSANEAKELERHRRQAEEDARAEADQQQLNLAIDEMNPAARLQLRFEAEAVLSAGKNYVWMKAKEGLMPKATVDDLVRSQMRKLLKARQADQATNHNPAIAPETPASTPKPPQADSTHQEAVLDAPEAGNLSITASVEATLPSGTVLPDEQHPVAEAAAPQLTTSEFRRKLERILTTTQLDTLQQDPAPDHETPASNPVSQEPATSTNAETTKTPD